MIAGSIPPCLGALPNLEWLYLSTNSLHGTIPSSLCELTRVTSIGLYENSLEGPLPSCIGRWHALKELDAQSNRLSGPLPAEMCAWSKLQRIYFYNNRFSGELPECIATAFPVATELLLHNNRFRGPLPRVWNAPSLVSLVLSNNPRLSGSLPASLFQPQALGTAGEASAVTTSTGASAGATTESTVRSVVIEGTGLSGTLPDALCAAGGLEVLALSGNMLRGSLPECIVRLSRLRELRAASNRIAGRLPEGLGNLTNLEVLDLGDNRIGGTVPASFGALAPKLARTTMSLNDLSCDLPLSVLHWEKPPGGVFRGFNLLPGNLFGCPGGDGFWDFLALSMAAGAPGLAAANPNETRSYRYIILNLFRGTRADYDIHIGISLNNTVTLPFALTSCDCSLFIFIKCVYFQLRRCGLRPPNQHLRVPRGAAVRGHFAVAAQPPREGGSASTHRGQRPPCRQFSAGRRL